jgi:hypothetical protein
MERFILAQGFRGFSPAGSFAFWPVVRQNIVAEVMVEQSCSPHGGQEAGRETEKGVGDEIQPLRHPQ